MEKGKLKKEWSNFWDDIEAESTKKNSKFWTTPVSPKVFFEDWLGFTLFPRQYKLIENVFDKKFDNINSDFHEYVIAWGKRSGKDIVIAHLLCYMIYWLLCLNNPQRYLGIQPGEPIDIINVSFDSDQALSVFFEKFTRAIESTIDPITNKNFFKSVGMNLDRDILKNSVEFPKNIRAFSLNCLPYQAKVMTKLGYLRIGDIVKKRIKTEVQSFNIKTNTIEWKPICNWFDIEDKNINWYKIDFDFNSSYYGGKSLVCTNDHRVYVKGKGMVLAKDLHVNDRVINARPAPSENQLQVILGGLLGDSSISKNEVNFGHCVKQKDYLMNKYNVLKTLVNKEPQQIFNGGDWGSFEQWTFQTKALQLCKYLSTKGHERFIKILPKLTPLGLAVWYMDDGFLAGNSASIALPPVSDKVCKFIIKELKLRGLSCKIIKNWKKCKRTILSFNKENSEIFFNLIAKYIPQNTQYKLSDKYKNLQKYSWNTEEPIYTEVAITKITKNYKKSIIDNHGWKKNVISTSKKYCIEVADNHNFFCNGVLVANSKEFKAEGKNVVFAVFDEIGSFRFDKAEKIRRHIKSTAKPTCPHFYKLFYISFLTSGNDYMAYLLSKAREMKSIFFDRGATWDIRSGRNCTQELKKYVVHKADYQDEFDEDPSSAMLMYECKVPKFKSNAFIKRPERITQCANMERPIPFVGLDRTIEEATDNPYDEFWTTNLLAEELEPWFKPNYTWEMSRLEKDYENNPTSEISARLAIEKERHSNADYFVHIDLSRGIVDCAGLVMGHKYKILDKTKIYIDLAIQIRAPKSEDSTTQEIDMETILDFVIDTLHKKKRFNIVQLTADGWNSALFLSMCNKNGIPAEILSVDRNTIPYETLKDFIYREDISYYFYPPLIRELTELENKPNKKIDHPANSQWRMREEKLPRGSKDVSDCVAGVVYKIIEETDEEPLGYGAK